MAVLIFQLKDLRSRSLILKGLSVLKPVDYSVDFNIARKHIAFDAQIINESRQFVGIQQEQEWGKHHLHIQLHLHLIRSSGQELPIQLIVLGRIPTALIFVGDFSRRTLSKTLERSKYTTGVHFFSSMASHWEMWGARCLPICPWGGHTGYHRCFCAFLDVFLENLLKSFCEYWSDANWTNLSLRDPFLKVGATKTCFHLRVTSLMNSN